MTIHTHACFSSHIGPYMMRPDVLDYMARSWNAGRLPVRVTMMDDEDAGGERKTYEASIVKHKGTRIAIFPVIGEMSKRPSKYADVSTLHMRAALRRVNQEGLADAIVLHIDTNGGMAEGMAELSDELRNSAIPVHAYVDDKGFSAGYFAATSASSISVNRAGFVGSIGTIAVLVDNTKALEQQGVRVIAVTTAPQKTLGMDGKPVTDDDIAIIGELVRKVNEPFAQAVKSGRGLNDEQYAKVSTGALFRADEAKELGLIDHIETLDAFLDRVASGSNNDSRARAAARVRVAKAS